MRLRNRDLGHLPLLKFAGAALIASITGACSSDVMRLSDNAFSNPFASSSRVDTASTGSVGNAPVQKVQSSSLSAPTYQPLPRNAGSIGQVPSASKLAAAGNTPVLGAAKGWSAQGGTPVTLGDGDTVETLSGRYGVPVAALRSVNGLSGNSQPSAGQQFIIPAFNPGSTGSVAKAAAPIAAPAVAQSAPRYEEIKAAPARAKDTARSLVTPKATKADDDEEEDEKPAVVPKAPSVPGFKPLEKKVSAVNTKVDTANSAIDKARDAKTKLAAAAPSKSAPAKPSTSTQKSEDDDDDEPVKTAEAPKAAPAKSAPSKSAPAKAAEPVKTAKAEPAKTAKAAEPEHTGTVADPKNDQEFRWPARGRVIQGFGSKGASGTNDGINIALPEGTPVRAAEGGTVAYAGEEIKGYGKMVLIRHPNGYVSAYAHNGDVNVKRGDTIKRGQVIAKSGQTGNVTSPQLHFELRKGAEPVDPTKFLEGN